jgi:aminobenzoyl-glutamate utilization protein B
MFKKINYLILLLLFGLAEEIYASSINQSIINHKKQFSEVALKIWDFAEMGYQETKSSNLLASELEKEGFKITRNVADIPTAFIAEFGSSGPIVGILGEFDALPGLAQSNSPFKDVIDNGTGAGHACGHHLFGAASAWAAVVVKEWLESNNIKGRVRFYGTPAEEGGSGKVYMVREGLFVTGIQMILTLQIQEHQIQTNQQNLLSAVFHLMQLVPQNKVDLH